MTSTALMTSTVLMTSVLVTSVIMTSAVACAPGTSDVETHPTGAGGSSSPSSSSNASSSSNSSSSSQGVGAGGSGGMGGAGGCDFSHVNTCETAEVLMQVDGDQGAGVVTATGVGSKWLRIRINEGSSAPSQMKYRATITSAAGSDYDLYVRRGDDTNYDCTFPPVQAMGTPEVIEQQWADQTFNTDDSRIQSFEVVYVSGDSCDMAAEWEVKIEGNVP